MVIQCRQCRTKFYFDDTLMLEDGLWMRCSRCGHVFFQNNPLTSFRYEKTPTEARSSSTDDEKIAEQKTELTLETSPPTGPDEDVIRFLDNVLEAKKESAQRATPEPESFSRGNLRRERFEGEMEGEGAAGNIPERAAAIKPKKQVKESGGKGWKVFIWSVLVILVIPAAIYFVLYPQMGDRFIEMAHKYINDPEPARPEVVIAQVKLENISQRIITNSKIGEIRVMEGVAVNQADYAISRIMVKGTIIDENSIVLGEQTSYAGNILTEEELTTLSAEEMAKILARPEGGNNRNDKIVPNGQIPFMIVFTGEPPGVIKTTVTVIGAERLL